MILRSFSDYAILVEFDPVNAVAKKISPSGRASSRADWNVCGVFGELAGALVSLYRAKGVIYLQIDGDAYLLDENVSVSYQKSASTCSLAVKSLLPDGKGCRVDYPAPEVIGAVGEDPTPFVDEEDFDFGLMIFNVASDAERRWRMYR